MGVAAGDIGWHFATRASVVRYDARSLSRSAKPTESRNCDGPRNSAGKPRVVELTALSVIACIKAPPSPPNSTYREGAGRQVALASPSGEGSPGVYLQDPSTSRCPFIYNAYASSGAEKEARGATRVDIRSHGGPASGG